MMLIETCVRPSGIHGLGLFAIRFTPRGAPIWRFEPDFDQDFSPARFAALPPLAQEHVRWFSFVSRLDGHFMLSGDHARFMNHSRSPNSGVAAAAPDVAASGLLCAGQPVVTEALRDIVSGEEITCNYYDFDADAPRKLGVAPAAPTL